MLENQEFSLGEYFCHLYLEETRDLKCDVGLINCVIKVTCMKNTIYSPVKKELTGSSDVFWGEHMFFNKNFDNRKQLENLTLNIEVINKKAILKDSLIGSCSINVSGIYFNKDKTLKHKWMILQNPDKQPGESFGYLRFSINFTKAGESKADLEIQDPKLMNMNLNPDVKIKKKQLKVFLYEGKDIIKTDTFGGVDPFIQVEFGGIKKDSNFVSSNRNPKFNEVVKIPIIEPSLTKFVKLLLYDHDSGMNNDLIGSYSININDITSGKFKEIKWIHFYGDNNNDDNTINRNSDMGVKFKGSVYLSIEIEDCDDPLLVNEPLPKEKINYKKPNPMRYCMKAKLEYLMAFGGPPKSSNRIKISWGPNIKETSKIKLINNFLSIYENFEIEADFEVINESQLPDVFINVESDGDLVTNYRFRIEEIIKIEKIEYDIKTMKILKEADGLNPSFPGHLSILLGIQNQKNWNNMASICQQNPNSIQAKNYSKWFKSIEKGVNDLPILIVVNLIQAKNLPSGDDNGLSDPFILVNHITNFYFSTKVYDSLSPVWHQRICLPSHTINNKIPPLVLAAFDSDSKKEGIQSGDDLIGTTLYEFKRSDYQDNFQNIQIPKWITLINGKEKVGKLLCSVSVYKLRNVENIPKTIPIKVQFEKYILKMCILGLRNLKSKKGKLIKNPRIVIDTKCLYPNYLNIKPVRLLSISKNGGNNPNFGSILNIKLELPSQIQLMPTFGFRVFDGEGEIDELEKDGELIGVFEVGLEEIVYNSLKRYEKNLLNILDQLKNDSTVDKGPINFSLMKTKEELDIDDQNVELDTNLMNPNNPNTISRMNESRSKLLNESANYNLEKDVDVSNLMPHENSHIGKQYQDEKNNFETIKLVMDKLIEKQNRKYEKHLKNPVIVLPEYESDKINKNDKKNAKSSLLIERKSEYLKNNNFYTGLGYDSKKEPHRKHYRINIDDKLENTPYLGISKFKKVPIFRGKKLGNKNGFLDFFGLEDEGFKKVGSFKGSFQLIHEKFFDYSNNIKLKPNIKTNFPLKIKDWENDGMDKEILKNVEALIRVYVIDARLYKSSDAGSLSDPYLKISLGDKEFNDKENYFNNDHNPKFLKCFEFSHSFPGASDLKIELVDYDPIISDDLIGHTIIDIERRFFDETFRNLDFVPIEKRNLYHPDSSEEIGTINLWVDMKVIGDREVLKKMTHSNSFKPKEVIEEIKKKKTQENNQIQNKEGILLKTLLNNEINKDLLKHAKENYLKWQINSMPPTPIEVRLIVYECNEVPIMDNEGTTDIFVNGILNNNGESISCSTDTHFRSQNGFGSFNWRIKYLTDYISTSNPEKCYIELQIMDFDLIGNEAISTLKINIFHMLKITAENQIKFSAQKNDYLGKSEDPSNLNSGLKLIDSEGDIMTFETEINTNNDEIKDKPNPKLKIAISMIPKELAEKMPVGIGRGDPNQDPFLDKPTGRMEFSLNPITMFNQLVGPGFRAKCCMYCCILCCIILLIAMLPLIISNISSNMIMKIFGLS